jgi:hypothetical protein
VSATAIFPAYTPVQEPPRATHTRIIRRTTFRGVDVDVEIDLVFDMDRVTVAVVLCDADPPEPPPAQLGGPMGLARSRRMVSSSASSNS